jgi:hypothetical protein
MYTSTAGHNWFFACSETSVFLCAMPWQAQEDFRLVEFDDVNLKMRSDTLTAPWD